LRSSTFNDRPFGVRRSDRFQAPDVFRRARRNVFRACAYRAQVLRMDAAARD
jgi:hypothetical protein